MLRQFRPTQRWSDQQSPVTRLQDYFWTGEHHRLAPQYGHYLRVDEARHVGKETMPSVLAESSRSCYVPRIFSTCPIFF